MVPNRVVLKSQENNVQKRIISAAGAFIFNSQKKLFLAKFKDKFDETWSIPGGKIDFGETPLQAVVREVKEESNLDLTDINYFCTGAFSYENTHVVYTDYIANCLDEDQVKINDEFSEFKFCSLLEAMKRPMIPQTRLAVQSAFQFINRQSIIKKLSSYNFGLIRQTIHFQNVQENWPDAFKFIAEKIHDALPSKAFDLYHVGSSSIPDAIAKPILDIVLSIHEASTNQIIIEALEQVGFTYKGDYGIKNRLFFAFYNNDKTIDYIHIHAFPQGHGNIEEMLNFRDKLRSSHEKVREYNQLKIKMRNQGVSRKQFSPAKTDFVRHILGNANDSFTPSTRPTKAQEDT